MRKAEEKQLTLPSYLDKYQFKYNQSLTGEVVEILNGMNVPYQTYDILSDEELRSGIKEFSSWPTIPQLYINGEFIGGCDICIEMSENGELAKKLND